MSELVADYVLKRLREWGVDRIYGYPGDGINAFLGALDRAKDELDFIQARHEEMAAFMACGHAKFAGPDTIGVCMATSGPGAIHLLNGLYDAKLDHQPVVAIVGDGDLQMPIQGLWTATHHRFPIVYVVRNTRPYNNDEQHQDRVAQGLEMGADRIEVERGLRSARLDQEHRLVAEALVGVGDEDGRSRTGRRRRDGRARRGIDREFAGIAGIAVIGGAGIDGELLLLH